MVIIIAMAYVVLGVIWAAWTLLVMHKTINGIQDGLIGFCLNMIFWPVIMIFAYAVGKFFAGLRGD